MYAKRIGLATVLCPCLAYGTQTIYDRNYPKTPLNALKQRPIMKIRTSNDVSSIYGHQTSPLNKFILNNGI